jgi:hypothetical protein
MYSDKIISRYARTTEDPNVAQEYLRVASSIPFNQGQSPFGRLCSAGAYNVAFMSSGSLVRGFAEGLGSRYLEMIMHIEREQKQYRQQMQNLLGKKCVFLLNDQWKVGIILPSESSEKEDAIGGLPLLMTGEISDSVQKILAKYFSCSEEVFSDLPDPQVPSEVDVTKQPVVISALLSDEMIASFSNPTYELRFEDVKMVMYSLEGAGLFAQLGILDDFITGLTMAPEEGRSTNS